MPLYEYRCEKCGHRIEIIQTFSDRPLKTCPECKGKLVKVFSAPALQFKGSGFYITDYTDKGKPPKSESGDKSEKKSTEKSQKSESKPSGETKSTGSTEAKKPVESKSSSSDKSS